MTKNSMNSDLRLSLVISGVLSLQILTFPKFFLFNPFSNSLSVLLTVAQVATVMGWILILLAPPILMILREKVAKRFTLYLTIAALVWPGALILVRFAVLSLTGDPAIHYLFNYPIFMFSDIAVPILYWRMARR